MNAVAAGLSMQLVRSTLERTGLESCTRKKIGHLSVGMRQRLAIGAALQASPRLLVLDEPFNGLDPDGNAWLRESILDHARRGNAVLISTHFLREAELYTDHVVVLDAGKVRAIRSAERTPVRIGCVPVEPERFRQALKEGKVDYLEEEGTFLVGVEPVDLLLFCNRERLGLVSLDLNANSRLENIFRCALNTKEAKGHD
ncbi:ATP-binding cassette domain-containing protein [bacterium RCC_150]